ITSTSAENGDSAVGKRRPTPEPSREAMVQTVADAVRRAEQGDASMVPVVRDLLAQPGFVDRLGGDLARRTQETLIAQLAGQDLVQREALLCKVGQLRAEVAGPSPAPIERLLAEGVATCWLQMKVEDLRDARSRAEELPLAERASLLRRLDAAHRRF